MKQLGESMNNAGTRRRGRSRLISWGIILIMVIGIALAIVFYVRNGLSPEPVGESRKVEIATGMTAIQVADLLEREGIIRNSFLFKYYLKYYDQGANFQAGSYELAPGITNDALIAKLNNGETIKPETIRFTIPEGYTVLQIADKLAAEGYVDQSRFLALADAKRQWPGTEAANMIPDKEDYKHRLEGYLFPETYELKIGATEEEIIDRMLTELDKKLSQLPDNWKAALQERHMTVQELLTVASLVEREAVIDEERPLIAGVIYNRLNKPMRLQIDATVQYLLDKPKERLYEKDLTVQDPYNTYQSDGLPPGPIASPSLKSIKAALYPESSKFFYYVTKKDGSQKHLFAETYKQHLKNIATSNK